MKILIINKNDTIGGAAIAARRTMKALQKHTDFEVKMLVDIKNSKEENIFEISNSWLKSNYEIYLHYAEKLLFFPFAKKKEYRFKFSTAIFGKKISKHKLVLESDIINIHWINNSFVTIKELRNIINLGKPVYITMHDMWYATGGCHHSRDCNKYTTFCNNCFYLKSYYNKDHSYFQYQKKLNLYKNVTFIGVSNWITNECGKSALFNKSKLISIPNPIDIFKYKKLEKIEIRNKLNLKENKFYILFVSANVNDKRKGINHLLEAIELLPQQIKERMEILIVGKKLEIELPKYYISIGYIGIEEQMINYYNAADIFITPSLEDNLPNTIMESLSCGTPVVAFRIGGIPQLIDHKLNGYLANYKDDKDLANGIEWIFNFDNRYKLSDNCISKVHENFEESVIAKKYFELYNPQTKSE